MVIGLITLGKYLEARAKSHTSSAIQKLIGLQAKTARVIRDGKDVDVPIEDVVVGDLIRVRAGEKVPVDGVIVEGESVIDESLVTGESMPIDKVMGSNVIGADVYKRQTHNYEKKTTSGKFKVIYINTPDEMKKAFELIDRNPETSYFE